MINRMYGNNANANMSDSWVQFKTELVRRNRTKGLASVFNIETHYRDQLFHSTFYGILPTLLRNYDHYSMHAGVEVRMPFLDYRIIAFAFTLPNEYKIRNGFSKAIVREAAKPIVPAHILQNKVKTGWNSPMGEWLSGNWKQWILDEVHSTAFKNCDLIDQPSVLQQLHFFYKEERYEHTIAQTLWLQLQPYFIEKANQQFALL